MSNNDIVVIQSAIKDIESEFKEIANSHNSVAYEQEAMFALQIITKKGNDFLLNTAKKNPESLRAAVKNVAAVGLTLNPTQKLAYLIPRDSAVIMDISYMGMISIVTTSGAMKFVRAVVVRKEDKFEYRGETSEPLHRCNPFGDRGPIIGVYCIAKTFDNEILCGFMDINHVYSTGRDRSDAWKAYKKGKTSTCTWIKDEEEMVKKTIIRREFKTWPKVAHLARVASAIDVLNTSEGYSEDFEDDIIYASENQLEEMREIVIFLDKEESNFLKYANTVLKKSYESLEEMDVKEAEKILIQIREMKKTVKAKREFNEEHESSSK